MRRRRPDAALDPGFAAGADGAVFERVVGVDAPAEQLAVEPGGLVGCLRDDLELQDGVVYAVMLAGNVPHGAA